MKSQISSLDVHFLVKEMQFLIGGRVDKIYHPKKDELLIQFHITGEGKSILRIIPGKFIFLSDYKGEYESPGGFCMFLRKYLDNSRLREITQIGSERIVLLIFETKDAKLKLYAELFGKGNIIVTDENENILSALVQQKWSDREIKKGVVYNFPKKQYDLFNIKEKEFIGLLKSDKELVYALAKEIGIGGVYAEEICAAAEIDKNKKNITETESKKVFNEFKKIIEGKLKPTIVYKKDKLQEILPIQLKIFEGSEKKEFDSFNSAFDYFFREELAEKEEFKSKHQNMIDKTKNVIDQQQKQIDDLEKKAAENNKKGELIYENYQMIESILKEINKAREKYSFDEIKEKLKGHKVVKDVDGKNKRIVIEL